MKWQKVLPLSNTWPALSRLALVQTCVGPTVMHGPGGLCLTQAHPGIGV